MTTYPPRLAVVGFLALAAFGAGLVGVASAAEVANTIRYGVDDEQNINRLPQIIAERQGFFAREGLRVQIVPFVASFRTLGAGQNPAAAGARPPSLRDAMAKGDVDMSRQQFPLLVNANMAGGKNVGVAVAASNPVYYLIARPEIKSFADLKGKTIAVTNLSDGITIWTRKLMAQHGLGKDDVKLKVIAGNEGRLPCLMSGECAAAALPHPIVFELLDAGYHALGLTNEIGPLLYQFDIVNPIWAAAHRDLVVKYIRATVAAMHFIQDPKNREDVVKVTMAFMKEPENRSRQMVASITDPKNRVLPQQAALDMNEIKAAISLMGEYDILKQPLPTPDRFVDPAYAKAAGP